MRKAFHRLGQQQNISFLGDGGYGTGGASLTLNVPAGIQSGDLMLAFMTLGASRTAGSFSAPAGWTALPPSGQQASGAHFVQGFYFWRVAGPSEPPTYTFNTAGGPQSPFCDGNIRGYHGTSTNSPIGATSVAGGGAVTSVTVPALPGFAPGEWAVYCVSSTQSGAYSSSSPNPLSDAVYLPNSKACAYEIGDFIPQQPPAAETLTWAAAGGAIFAIGITILP
ncbi:MAG: hypothetical protein ACRD9W_16555 [Terriglobia bacterium]